MTIYFKNSEKITILGEESDIIMRKIAYALEHNMRDWIVIYNQEEEVSAFSVPDMIIKLDEIVAIR